MTIAAAHIATSQEKSDNKFKNEQFPGGILSNASTISVELKKGEKMAIIKFEQEFIININGL